MPALSRPTHLTLADFLAWEEEQEFRHEFVDGEIFAMVGGTLRHGHIGLSLAFALRSQFSACGCQVYHEGVKVKAGSNIFYPDVVVECGDGLFEGRLLERPAFIVEVLSDSTEIYDRGLKWKRYQQHLPSLQAYVLVAQDDVRVEVFRRAGEEWSHSVHTDPAEVLEFSDPPCRLELAEIYQGVLERLLAARAGG